MRARSFTVCVVTRHRCADRRCNVHLRYPDAKILSTCGPCDQKKNESQMSHTSSGAHTVSLLVLLHPLLSACASTSRSPKQLWTPSKRRSQGCGSAKENALAIRVCCHRLYPVG